MLRQPNAADILGRLDSILYKGIQEGVFPGAALWVGWHGETIKCSSYGKAAPDGYHLHWHLLTHASGLPIPLLYEQYRGKANILEGICQQTLLFSPGTRYFYSDLGFILLGAIVSITTSLEISEYARKYLFEPLEMKDTMFNPPEAIWDRVAPTEYVPWRGGLVQGYVHDENAWALDGVAGHAGLFSTVEDLAKFSNMILGFGEFEGKRVLEANSIFEMMKPQINLEGSIQGLGWMINTPSYMGRLANIDSTLANFGEKAEGKAGLCLLQNPSLLQSELDPRWLTTGSLA